MSYIKVKIEGETFVKKFKLSERLEKFDLAIDNRVRDDIFFDSVGDRLLGNTPTNHPTL